MYSAGVGTLCDESPVRAEQCMWVWDKDREKVDHERGKGKPLCGNVGSKARRTGGEVRETFQRAVVRRQVESPRTKS